MPILVAIPHPDSADRSRLLSVQQMRRRALERLYERKFAVENLIQSLEDYKEFRDESDDAGALILAR